MTLDNPDGVFADFNRTLPYLNLGLPASNWQGASENAARGLNLATEGACAAHDGTLWIADASEAQKRAIRQACALGEGTPAVNRTGEQAWMRFDRVWQTTLTPVQRQRIAAMSEHGSDGHGADDQGNDHSMYEGH